MQDIFAERRKIHVRRKSRTRRQKDDQPFAHFTLCRQSEKGILEQRTIAGRSRRGSWREPTDLQQLDLADYFRVSTDYLLGRTETVSPDTSIAGCGKLTGLSDKSIEKLIALYQENWENWHTYLLNDIIEADEFQLFLESLMNYVTTSDEEVKSISLDDSITNRDVYELKTNRLFQSIVQHLIAVYKPRLSEYNKAMSDAFVSKIVNGLHDAGGITDELWQEAMETYEKGGNPYKVLYDSISKEEGDDTDNGEYHPAQE